MTVGSGAGGDPARDRVRFRTQDLTLDHQTYPSIAPLGGSTVGVGMPVVMTFDVPVTDRTAAERHLSVSSTPAVPRTYWPSAAEVGVHADLNSVDVGSGIYGQESRTVRFTLGRSVVSRIDLDSTGIDPDHLEYYDPSDVQYAMRETYSGEFILAAP